MSRRYLLPPLLALGLGACATMPQQLAGNYTTVTPDQARGSQAQGTTVRWGGRIIDTEPREAQTCFFVLAKTLDGQARPTTDEQSNGRFVACKDGFYDPEVYAKGRDLTVTGTLQGSMTRKVGEYDYSYPLVQTNVVYLWPKRPVYTGPQPDPFWDPFWGPWGPGPWFYPPPVVVIPNPPPPPPPPPSHH